MEHSYERIIDKISTGDSDTNVKHTQNNTSKHSKNENNLQNVDESEFDALWERYGMEIEQTKQWQKHAIQIQPSKGFVAKGRLNENDIKIIMKCAQIQSEEARDAMRIFEDKMELKIEKSAESDRAQSENSIKLFINVVHDASIGKPHLETITNTENASENGNTEYQEAQQRLRIPLSCTVPCVEVDKEHEIEIDGNMDVNVREDSLIRMSSQQLQPRVYVVVDACIHPETAEECKKDARFRETVMAFIVGNLNQKHGLKINHTAMKFPRRRYKRQSEQPVPHFIRKGDVKKPLIEVFHEDDPSSSLPPEESLNISSTNASTESNKESWNASIHEPSHSPPLLQTSSLPDLKVQSSVSDRELCSTPTYTIYYLHADTHEFISEVNWRATDSLPVSMLVEITLPGVSSISDLVLEATTNSISVNASDSSIHDFELFIPLSHRVDIDNAASIFVLKSSTLKLRLPVLPQHDIASKRIELIEKLGLTNSLMYQLSLDVV